MTDLLQVDKDARPWLPSPDTTQVKTYHRHQVPLIGLVRQQGSNYLFVCRYRGDEQLSLWMYAHLSDEDMARLDDSCSSTEEFGAVLDEFESKRHVVYALAHEDRGVIDTFENRGPETSARRLRSLLQVAVAEDPGLGQDAAELVDAFAGVRAGVLRVDLRHRAPRVP